jgi:tetratricopeptide (TPR) repeat protein
VRIAPDALKIMVRQICLTVVFLFLLFVGPTFAGAQMRSAAQPAEIRGQLRYAQGGAPAPDVVVRLDQLSGGFVSEVRTDRLGKFRITNLSPVQYQVIIRQPGYREIQYEVNLVLTSSEYLQLQLVEESATPASSPKIFSAKILDASVPPDARREFEKGEALVATGEKGKMAEGIRNFQRAIVIYPSFLEAKLKLGTTHMDLMQWSEAEQVLLKASETHPQTPHVLFALGELFLQQKKTREAEKVLREGLQIEPRSWQGHFTLGRLYWNSSDIVRAGRQVGLALQLNPDFADAHLLAGNILLRARKIEEAQFEFEEYIRLAPKGKYATETRQVLQKIKRPGAKNNLSSKY